MLSGQIWETGLKLASIPFSLMRAVMLFSFLLIINNDTKDTFQQGTEIVSTHINLPIQPQQHLMKEVVQGSVGRGFLHFWFICCLYVLLSNLRNCLTKRESMTNKNKTQLLPTPLEFREMGRGPKRHLASFGNQTAAGLGSQGCF